MPPIMDAMGTAKLQLTEIFPHLRSTEASGAYTEVHTEGPLGA